MSIVAGYKKRMAEISAAERKMASQPKVMPPVGLAALSAPALAGSSGAPVPAAQHTTSGFFAALLGGKPMFDDVGISSGGSSRRQEISTVKSVETLQHLK